MYDMSKHVSVMGLPFLLYYKLQSYFTTNIYELPCRLEQAFDLDGSAGWKGAGEMAFGNSWIHKIVGKIPGLGDHINSLFKNIRINYMSSWDPEAGSMGVSFPALSVKFNLFNDTLESAITNYIFINTVAPGNMWVQQGLIQHSGSVYDVKVDGHSRMFMCTGQVKVGFKGVLRDPPPSFFDQLVYKHINPNIMPSAEPK